MPRFRVAFRFLFIFPCILSAQAIPEHRARQPTEPLAGATGVDAAIARLTTHSGLDTDAAWSPDGRSIAYASDRSGNFEIWVQPVDGGGEATQITKDSAGDWQPQWAPDGKRLVFRSERDGGGLFVVSAQGSDVRRLTTFGYQPQWSPDGRRILFTASHLLVMSQRQRFYMVSEAGGEPLEVLSAAAERFSSVPVAGWHPDGQRVSLAGLDEKGRVLVRTTAIEAEKALETQLDPTGLGETDTHRVNAVMWSRGGDALFVTATGTDGIRVWRVPIDAETGKRKGSPQQMATRAHGDQPMALSPDGTRLAFTMARQASRIWTYPLESARGRIAGPPRAITSEDAWALAPDFSPDGKKLVYVLLPDIWSAGSLRLELHEWTASGDRTLAADNAARFAPRVSRDGRYVAFRVTPPGTNVNAVAVLDSTTLKERRLTSSSLFATAFGWTHDNASILASIRQDDPPRHGLFRVPFSAGEAPSRLPSVAVHPKYDIWQGTQSPDGKWIAFVVQEPNPRWSAIFLAAAGGGPWIQVTDGRGWDDKPRWSADGRLLYFVTSRGGPYTVAAVGIDQLTGKPAGPVGEVLSWPAPRLALLGDVAWNELALGGDALAVPLVETTGSTWTTGAAGTEPRTDASNCADLVLPEVIERPAPVYTPEARRRKLAGTVHLEAVVGIDGRVRSLRVVRSPDARLNPEAVCAASRWTFRPARCKGENVALTVPVAVVFAPK